jgi:multiple sugar transport system substrate-binding protein
MDKKIFRSLLLLIIAFMLAVNLSACQSTSEVTSTPTAETPIPVKATTKALKSATPIPNPSSTKTTIPTSAPQLQVDPQELSGISLNFWYPWTGYEAQAIADLLSEFNQTNLWGIEVTGMSSGGTQALADKIQQNLEDGQLPNIVAAPSDLLQYWQRKPDLLVNLDIYINDAYWGLKDQELADIPQLFWTQDVSQGKQIGLPFLRDMRVILYNQSWAEAIGFPTPPQDLSAFEKQVCTAANIRAPIDLTGGWIIDLNPMTVYSWLLTTGTEDVFDSKVESYQFDQPGVQDAFNYLLNLQAEDCVWNSRQPYPYEYFANRQVLAYTGSVSDIIPEYAAMQQAQSLDAWEILPFPGENGEPVAVTYGTSLEILNSTEEEQLASWIFLHWLMLPRNQAAMIEASGYLPASASAVQYLEDFRKLYPQWDQALQLIPVSHSVPSDGSWLIVKNILSDAAWQVMQPNMPAEVIPQILQQLDETIPDVWDVDSGQK